MKKIKKLTAVIMTIVMLLTVVPFTGIGFTKAGALDAAGQLNDTISYTFDSSTGTLTISGTGDMPNYSWRGSPFYNNSSIKIVIIEDGVTKIGSYVFSCCYSLESITLSDGITRISDSAFYYCQSLTEITIPTSVTSIESGAFRECNSLTSIIIPDSVTNIGSKVFDSCTDLTSITVDENNPVYDSRDNCSAIIETATNTLIMGCKNTIIPNSVTSIGNYAFYYCESLTNITIPDRVTSIGGCAFDHCTNLTEITIPDSVTSIGYYAFFSCESLTSITIPDSVTSIGFSAFEHCTNLTEITIPDSVTSIESGAFRECNSLTSVTIPASVTFIEYSAFEDCTSLTSIIIDENNPTYDSRNNCNAIIETATNTLIAGCKNTTIPDSVTSIGDDAFRECTGLTSITIPDSVTSIGYSAFEHCTNLTEITIPDSVTSIESGTFRECTSLTSITIPDSVTSIDDWAFSNCESLTAITIPDGVTSIGYGALGGCTGLTSITIPDSVTSIGNYAFEYCDSLTSITIPASVTSIGNCAFLSCNNLTEITIPYGVTNIGGGAFEWCTSLTSIIIDENNPTYDSRNNCNAIIKTATNTLVAGCKNTIIPDSVTSIGEDAFGGCNSLTSITIPDSVTSIGEDAFWCCHDLTDVYYGGTEGEWNAIEIGYGNAKLLNANIHFLGEPADYTAVFSAIENANSLNSNDYTEETWANVIDAIHAVEYDLNCAHQAEVDAMADAINDAIDALDVYIPVPDFTEIDKLLEQVAGLDENDYTPESWANLQRAVDAVSTLYIGTKTQPVVDNTASALKAAINALEKAHIHTLKHIVVPSTCTVQGMEYDLCTGCRKTMNQTVLPLAEHTWGEWVRTLEPTTKEEGVEERTCSVCGAVETRFIEKLNEIVDEKTGISITYGDEFAEGVEVDVVEEFDGTSFQILSADYDGNIDFRMFDITPTVDGEKTQPTGTVTVRIPVPAEFNGTDIFVVYVNSENGTTEDMPCTVADGYIEFQTTHFSHYAICQLIKAVRNVKLSDLTIKHNGTASLKPKITVDDGVNYTVRYESYDTSVADVDKDGTVNAVNSGETIIKCVIKDEYGNLVSDTCTVKVEDSFIQHFFRVFLSKLFGEKLADKVMDYFIKLAK